MHHHSIDRKQARDTQYPTMQAHRVGDTQATYTGPSDRTRSTTTNRRN